MRSRIAVLSIIMGTANISLNGAKMRAFFGLLPKELSVLTPIGLWSKK
jgi:hypothetical protein